MLDIAEHVVPYASFHGNWLAVFKLDTSFSTITC